MVDGVSLPPNYVIRIVFFLLVKALIIDFQMSVDRVLLVLSVAWHALSAFAGSRPRAGEKGQRGRGLESWGSERKGGICLGKMYMSWYDLKYITEN